MEIYDILRVTHPEDGHEVKLFLTKDEVQTLLYVGFLQSMAMGAVSLVTKKDGVDINDLDVEETGKPN